MRFRVLLADGSSESWGHDLDAAWETGRGGELRVIEFEPRPDGLHHPREARLYGENEWVNVVDE